MDMNFSNLIIIGIDGYDGSGKTSLAAFLASKIPGVMISVDDHIEKHKDSYVPALNAISLYRALQNHDGVVILEGVCLLSVVEKLGISLSCHIYIKQITEAGIWRDEEECTCLQEPELLIKKLENQNREFNLFKSNNQEIKAEQPNADLSGLRKEIIRYHSQFNPVEVADYVVNRNSLGHCGHEKN